MTGAASSQRVSTSAEVAGSACIISYDAHDATCILRNADIVAVSFKSLRNENQRHDEACKRSWENVKEKEGVIGCLLQDVRRGPRGFCPMEVLAGVVEFRQSVRVSKLLTHNL